MAALRVLTGCASAALSSLPTALEVTVNYEIDGQAVLGNPSCTGRMWHSTCLPRLQAENPNRKAVISYNVLPNATLTPGAHVILKACYSAPSAYDRAWRKANNIIVLDKLCPYTVPSAQPLPPTTGTAQWVPTQHVPDAAYFIRALAYCPNATYGTSPCGVGNSKAFFAVDQIKSRPGYLLGAIIGMCFAGPLVFVSYFAIDSALSKRKGKNTQGMGHAQHTPQQMDEKVSTLT
ncbi:hypothetical protein ABBQ32_004809 [Trebouxia sp. C0010 RCD-2024]